MLSLQTFVLLLYVINEVLQGIHSHEIVSQNDAYDVLKSKTGMGKKNISSTNIWFVLNYIYVRSEYIHFNDYWYFSG